MNRRSLLRVLVLLLVVAAVGYIVWSRRPGPIVLTGIVTTNDVIVSSQVAGALQDLQVAEGDIVKRDQVLATISPAELAADRAFYAETARGATAAVAQSQAALRFEEQQTQNRVSQAEAALAAAQAAQDSAAADLENAKLTYQRDQRLLEDGVVSVEQFDQARTTADALTAKVASLAKQTDGARAAVAMAKSNAEQVSLRQSQLVASQHESAAAEAQATRADVRLGYSEIHAPIDGIVQTRAARAGEVVGVGQPIVTLVNPDDFWIRVDVEEGYIDRLPEGAHVAVRLPSGTEVQGTVFYRGVDAGFATERDVSRTKRDIKTFEVRLRVDNRDRRLALGMTAYVVLPPA